MADFCLWTQTCCSPSGLSSRGLYTLTVRTASLGLVSLDLPDLYDSPHHGLRGTPNVRTRKFWEDQSAYHQGLWASHPSIFNVRHRSSMAPHKVCTNNRALGRGITGENCTWWVSVVGRTVSRLFPEFSIRDAGRLKSLLPELKRQASG